MTKAAILATTALIAAIIAVDLLFAYIAHTYEHAETPI